MIFKVYPHVCTNITTVNVEHFHHLKKQFCKLYCPIILFPPPKPQATTNLLSISTDLQNYFLCYFIQVSFAFDVLCFCLFFKVIIFTFLLGIEFLVDKNSFSVAVEVSFTTLNRSPHCLLSSIVLIRHQLLLLLHMMSHVFLLLLRQSVFLAD